MSYSRWFNSEWYVYPDIMGYVSCNLDLWIHFEWTPSKETFEDFMNRVRKNSEVSKQSADNLENILTKNMEDISKIFLEKMKK